MSVNQSYLEQIFGEVFSIVETFQVGDELTAGHPLPHVLHTHTQFISYCLFYHFLSTEAFSSIFFYCKIISSVSKGKYVFNTESLDSQTSKKALYYQAFIILRWDHLETLGDVHVFYPISVRDGYRYSDRAVHKC